MRPKIKNPSPARLPLAIDSGAYSLYMRHGAQKDEHGKLTRTIASADHSYASTPEFMRYFEDYMAFLKVHGKRLVYCVALDVIGNPERTWELYQEMRRQGLDVLPVVHFGENMKYLKRYMGETDYIGVGGLVKAGSGSGGQKFQRDVWKTISDEKGRPLVKIHAFGMASISRLMMYPYYSVDSTTAFTWSRYGCMMMPVLSNRKGWEYAKGNPHIIAISPGRSKAAGHANRYRIEGYEEKALQSYCELLGLTRQQLDEEYGARDIANLFFMNSVLKELAEKHGRKLGMNIDMLYYASGNFSSTLDIFNQGLAHLKKLGALKHLAYLGTFDAINPLQRVFRDWFAVEFETAGGGKHL